MQKRFNNPPASYTIISDFILPLSQKIDIGVICTYFHLNMKINYYSIYSTQTASPPESANAKKPTWVDTSFHTPSLHPGKPGSWLLYT